LNPHRRQRRFAPIATPDRGNRVPRQTGYPEGMAREPERTVIRSGTIVIESERFTWSVLSGPTQMIEVTGQGPGYRKAELGRSASAPVGLASRLAHEIRAERAKVPPGQGR
jgi:hypothetical protein